MKMKIKEQLLEAVSNEDTKITMALDNMFESVELTDTVRDKFSTVFESVIKSKSIELAESYISESATRAEEIIAEHKQELNEAAEKYGDHIAESMTNKLDSYLDHLADNWMSENKIAVTNGLKVTMFDNMMEGMKELFVENNISCPEDQIDVVATLEESVEDLENQLDEIVCENRNLKDYAQYVEKNIIIDESTKEMTESQKEKVADLAESIKFDDDFRSNLEAVIDFASGIKLSEKFGDKTEPKTDEDEDEKDDLGSDEDEKSPKKEDKKKDITESVPSMSQYLKATLQS